MPTRYNEKVLNGEEGFKEYAQRCVSAFVWEARDLPLGSPIPEPKKDTWPQRRLDELQAQLREKEAWTSDRWAAKEERTRLAANEQKREEAANRAVVRRRIETVLAQVNAYQPPTSEHENFKQFMIDQLQIGLQNEGRKDDPEWDAMTPQRTPDQYADYELTELRRMVASYRDDVVQAEKNYQRSIVWRQRLMDSLEQA